MELRSPLNPAPDDLSGRRLGGYRLLRLLGRGAMADVYLAEQQSLDRRVAVKVLRSRTVSQPAAVQRFTQEARAAAALVHGNIVQIHEVACIDGIHLLAEEYVAGPTLRAWLDRRGPLDARQALSVLGQVGSALERAASQGVVHRDIKPENLLVAPTGEVKVADFGLARVLTDGVGTDLTQDGTTLGTPLYMSPEQAEGKPVDTRSDLYSLGATLYHLLAGRPPFSGPTPLVVAMAHVTQPCPPLEQHRPDLPSDLTAVVTRLLEKAPEHRFAGPGDMLRAVEAAEQAVAPSSRRHDPSPLAWSVDGAPWDDSADVPLQAPAPGRSWLQTRTVEMRDATQRLQDAMEREQLRRDSERRYWLAVVAAGLALAAIGFAVGRTRPRTSRLFRQPR
ncbi:MAG: serine/threonine protein kinase [Planctomycetia bacterium]|nr:serine/threonine protein kinase [Planctomycetia bacterium]